MADLSREELLILLIEECGEVIQAATKCLRFGWDRVGPDGYGRNDLRLAEEVGDLRAIAAALPLSEAAMAAAMGSKIGRVAAWREALGAAPAPSLETPQ